MQLTAGNIPTASFPDQKQNKAKQDKTNKHKTKQQNKTKLKLISRVWLQER